jgi:hypothetical protein
MKARITFKNPEAAPNFFLDIETSMKEDGKSEEEIQEELAKAESILENFVRHNEYITVEIDMENNTCSVIKVK